jgi:hypothetical protein
MLLKFSTVYPAKTWRDITLGKRYADLAFSPFDKLRTGEGGRPAAQRRAVG